MYKLINSNNYQQRKRNLALKNIYEIVNNKMDIKKKKKNYHGIISQISKQLLNLHP